MKRFIFYPLLFITLLLTFGSCIRERNEVIIVAYSFLDFKAQDVPQPFEISTNFLWQLEVSDSWIKVTPVKGYADKTLTVTVENNPTTEDRSGSFFICGEKVRKEIKVNQKGETPTLTIEESSKTVNADGGTVEFKLTTNLDIEVSCPESWVSLVETKTIADRIYRFSVEKNTSLETRTAIIEFKQKNGNLKVTAGIGQLGEKEAITIDETQVNLPATSSSKTIKVVSNIAWEATTSADWITIVGSKLMQEGALGFAVAPNVRVESREGEIVVSKKGSSSLTTTIRVRQAGAEPSMVLTPAEFTDIPYNSAETYRVKVVSNFDWGLDKEDLASWVASVSINRADSTIRFTVAENEDVTSRTTGFRVVQEGGTFFKAVNIVQQASPERLSVSTGTIDIKKLPAEGGEYTFFVTSNVEWTATSDADWIRVVSTKGLNTQKLQIVVDGHSHTATRSASLTVVTSTQKAVIELIQLGASAVLKADPVGFAVNGAENTKEISVTSNVAWKFEGMPAWITVPEGVAIPDGLQTVTRKITIAANTQGSERQAVFRIVRTDGGQEQVNLRLSQRAPVIVLSVDALQVEAPGATGLKFLVKSEVPWKLMQRPEWMENVTVTPAGTAPNDSVVTFSVPANLTAADRSRYVVVRHKGGAVATGFVLSQKAGTLSVIPESVAVGGAGGQKTVLVKSNLPWETVELPTWVTPGSKTGTENTMDTTVTFNILENKTALDRIGEIVFRHKNGAVEARLSVAQQKPVLLIDRHRVDTVSAPAKVRIKVTADVPWHLSPLPQWVKLVSRDENGNVVLQLGQHYDVVAREASIRFIHTGGVLEQELVIRQTGAVMTLSPKALQFENNGGTKSFEVNSDLPWTLSGQPEWIQLNGTGGPSGHTVINVSLEANTSMSGRSGQIYLTAEGGYLKDTLSLTQAGGSPYMQASLSKSVLENTGDEFRMTVRSNVEAAYVLSADWITLSDRQTSEDGIETVYTFKVGPTTIAEVRRASIYLNASGVRDTLRFMQKAPHIAETDSLILVKLYRDLNGEGWRDEKNWNLYQPVTAWYGVGLRTTIQNGSYRVKSLTLKDARLRGTLPEYIRELEWLETLDLSDNVNLGGFLWSTWATMEYLSVLDISNCSLTNSLYPIPTAWGPLTSLMASPLAELKVLRLRGNYLSGEISEIITRHPHFADWDFAVNIAPQRTGFLTLPGAGS